MDLKISSRNVYRHKWSSLVLLQSFLFAAFVLYWVFGFGNSIHKYVVDMLRDSVKDITLYTEFSHEQEIDKLFSREEFIEKLHTARIARVMVDNPVTNGMFSVYELRNDERQMRLEKMKIVSGALPSEIDEIMVPEKFLNDKLKVGDTIYITCVTPNKIMNTLLYKIVGVNQSDNIFITQESMNLLLNSVEYINSIAFTLKSQYQDEQNVEKILTRAQTLLKQKGIELTASATFLDEFNQQSAGFPIISGIKILSLIVTIIMVAALLGALVWIHCYKQRKELWTFSALGFIDRRIIQIVTTEYWLIGLAGVTSGLVLGKFSAFLAAKNKVWLKFSDTFHIPLVASMSIGEIIFIYVAVIASVYLWVVSPVNRILKKRPFSF